MSTTYGANWHSIIYLFAKIWCHCPGHHVAVYFSCMRITNLMLMPEQRFRQIVDTIFLFHLGRAYFSNKLPVLLCQGLFKTTQTVQGSLNVATLKRTHLWVHAASLSSDNPSDPMRLKRGCKAVTSEAFYMHAKVGGYA